MNMSKVIVLLMLAASASSAFAGVRKKASVPASRHTATRQEARVQAHAQSPATCMYKSGGAHNQRPPAAAKNLVAGLLGLTGTKGSVKAGKGLATR